MIALNSNRLRTEHSHWSHIRLLRWEPLQDLKLWVVTIDVILASDWDESPPPRNAAWDVVAVSAQLQKPLWCVDEQRGNQGMGRREIEVLSSHP